MGTIQKLWGFLDAAAADPKLTPSHISLYLALLYAYEQGGSQNPVSIERHAVMRRAKIAGRTTYEKCIQELDQYGYLRYEPSFNRYLGSLVYLPGFPECIARIRVMK